MQAKNGFRNTSIVSTASILGILLALSGTVNHGIFEILQGNVATSGVFIEAIGTQQRFWVHGTESAFTIIPNYLFTGIVAIIISFLAMVWSAKFLDTKNGVKIFFILYILMALFGGGIGFLFIFLPTWAYATTIHSDLGWWRKKLSVTIQNKLSKIWSFSLIITSAMWLIIMELGIFGYFPGQSDPGVLLNIVMLFLLGAFMFTNITFISAISTDLQNRDYHPIR